MNIVWLTDSLDFDTASNRLRCFHFARYLDVHYNINSLITTTVDHAIGSLSHDSILIINNIIDYSILKLVYKAKYLNIPVVIDLHDVPPVVDYLEHLLDCIDLLTVPSWLLKQELLDLLSCDTSFHHKTIKAVPDIAEDLALIHETHDYYLNLNRRSHGSTSSDISIYSSISSDDYKIYSSNKINVPKSITLLEYPYSFSSGSTLSGYKKHLITLRKLQNIYGFNLQIFNLPSLDVSDLDQLQIEYTLVEFNLKNLLSILHTSDISLVAYPDDGPFNNVTSNFRELLSLSLGTPVISLNSKTNVELLDVCLSSLKDGINTIFSTQSNVELKLQQIFDEFANVSERFSLSSVSDLYFNLLRTVVETKNVLPTNLCDKEPSCSSLSIFVDSLGLRQLDDLYNELSKYNVSIKFINLQSPCKHHLDFYVNNSITPYLLYHQEFDQSLQLFADDDLIIYSETDLIESSIQSIKALCLSTNPSSESLFLAYSHLDSAVLSLILKPKKPVSEISLPSSTGLVDLLVVVPIQNKGWILDGIAKEIVSNHKSFSQIFYTPDIPVILPYSRNILFMHQSLVPKYLNSGLVDPKSTNISCWYTHSSGESPSAIENYLLSFNSIHRVIFTCSSNQKRWINLGVAEANTCFILGGFDDSLFKPHIRNSSQSIGICSSYYERKDPILIFELIKLLPQYHFLLLGRNWQSFSHFEYLMQLGNFTYKSVPYSRYPYYYSKMDVFLSPSKLEGGPIPVIEAMASNCFPVVSRTGFCPDIIQHGVNGFIFDVGSTLRCF